MLPGAGVLSQFGHSTTSALDGLGRFALFALNAMRIAVVDPMSWLRWSHIGPPLYSVGAASVLVVAITGASGAPYGVRLLEVLLAAGREVHLSVSPSGQAVIQEELGRRVDLDRFDVAELLGGAGPTAGRLHYHHHKNQLQQNLTNSQT
jgi:hypothetical protein